MGLLSYLFFVLFSSLFLPQPAFAYIDPGIGSVITQFLIGIFIGGLALIKVFWHKIKNFFETLFKNAKRKNK